MNKLNELKSVIHKANPEIKCRECPECGLRDGRQSGYCSCGGFLSEQPIERPIRLADVLVALFKKYPNEKDARYYTYHVDGFMKVYNNLQIMLGAEWNLLDDNLDHQSEETLEFLTNLLLNP